MTGEYGIGHAATVVIVGGDNEEAGDLGLMVGVDSVVCFEVESAVVMIVAEGEAESIGAAFGTDIVR